MLATPWPCRPHLCPPTRRTRRKRSGSLTAHQQICQTNFEDWVDIVAAGWGLSGRGVPAELYRAPAFIKGKGWSGNSVPMTTLQELLLMIAISWLPCASICYPMPTHGEAGFDFVQG